MAGRWFSPGTPVSSTNKTDRLDITEVLLKVPLNSYSKLNPSLAKTIFIVKYVKITLHLFKVIIPQKVLLFFNQFADD